MTLVTRSADLEDVVKGRSEHAREALAAADAFLASLEGESDSVPEEAQP